MFDENSCVTKLEDNTNKSSDDLASDYKKLEEKCEKILKRVKGRKARRGRGKKSIK